ncbi:MAG: succinylglutamate desuccinylase/aspartoacylase family protein [Gammaproteobacteria bacterium]|nr:succinylglutamate desuccinylase/aspartoacylase family protein [Gammaproteobacteria bacterium]
MSPGILKLYKYVFCLFGLLATLPVTADGLKHEVYKLQGSETGKTVLIVGGIQGDEPGGFTAASILVTNYKITKGNVWVIPNLNFNSIVQSSRGINGDMNRKFRAINHSDPDYDAVEEVKRLIRNDQVDLVLNLHDGSGFYRKTYIDKYRNPYRWGQSIVIDQSYLEGSAFPGLEAMGKTVADKLNRRLTASDHQYNVKNTRTRAGNREMQKTLTYYAVKHKKAAFGLEASKSFATHERVFFHLNLIEEFFALAQIEYVRDFELAMPTLKHLIGSNLALSLYEKRIALHLDDVQSVIRYFPITRDGRVEFEANNPLLAVVKSKGHYKVKYGNRSIARLYPQFFDYDKSLETVSMIVDGQYQSIPIGSTVNIDRDFLVKKIDGYRVNVIGFVARKKSEDELRVSRKSMLKRFSLDKGHNVYRVEFYKDNKFSGMVLVQFRG